MARKVDEPWTKCRNSTTHVTINTSFHLHITVSHSNDSTSHRIISHKWGNVSGSVLTSLRHEAILQAAAMSTFVVVLPIASLAEHPKIRPRTCHTRERLDRHSQTDQRSGRLRSQQPGLCDEILPCGNSGPTSPATFSNGKFQEKKTRPK